MAHFNYILTIHNKEALIRQVLTGVLLSSGKNSHIYAVLDGCSDGTERIIDELTGYYAGVNLTKVYTPDVHELLSINAGLRAAQKDGRQWGNGFNIILQDDVVLADRELENKVHKLYEWGGEKLGYVSFRLGSNLGSDAADEAPHLPLVDEIESAYGAGITTEVLLPGRFAQRTVPIKSPVCLPCRIVNDLGMFAEDLASYAYDDVDLAIRTAMAGYMNGVFGLRFYSDVRWGSTRKPGHPDIMIMVRRNAAILRDRFRGEMAQICSRGQGTAVFNVLDTNEAEDAHAMTMWKQSKAVFA